MRPAIARATFVFIVGLASVAGAQSNVPSKPGPLSACTFGSCFVPNFNASGEAAVYKGSGSTAEVADCCIPGDTYKAVLKNKSTGQKDKITFTSSGTLTSDTCSTGPYNDSHTLFQSGANKAKVKALALPGGVPAGAYIRLSGSWTQKKGADRCSGCALDASLCDDGNICTSDACLPDGTCDTTPVSCDDGNICTVDSCDPATGCQNEFTFTVTVTALPCDLIIEFPGLEYWFSYADYLARILTVDYDLENYGATDCTNVSASGTINTDGVTSLNTPIAIGTVGAHTSVALSVRYQLPGGVTSFGSGITIVDGTGGEEIMCVPGDVVAPPPPA